jgi:hypothetical protein
MWKTFHENQVALQKKETENTIHNSKAKSVFSTQTQNCKLNSSATGTPTFLMQLRPLKRPKRVLKWGVYVPAS